MINDKNCSLTIGLTAMDQKLQKSPEFIKLFYMHWYSLFSTIIQHFNNAIICIIYIKVLNDCAKQTVPMHRKQFYKFWWNQELECLKHESIDAHTMWKHAGKPRMG